MGKKKKQQINNNQPTELDVEKKIEESILSAYKKIKKEEQENNKPFINWLSAILTLLMILFVTVIAAIGWMAFRLLEYNINDGKWFTLYNLDFMGIIVIGSIIVIHTFKVNKHIDDVHSVSDLTSISSFLISCFALVVALLALLINK